MATDLTKKTSGRTREILDRRRLIVSSKASYGIWRDDLGLVEVAHRKGKSWHAMGRQEKAHFYCTEVEAAFMYDRCNLLVSKDNKLLSMKDLFSLLMARRVLWGTYYSYAYLKRAGYCLWKRPSPWQSLLKPPAAPAAEEKLDEKGPEPAGEEKRQRDQMETTSYLLEGGGVRGGEGPAEASIRPPKRLKVDATPSAIQGRTDSFRGWWQPVPSPPSSSSSSTSSQPWWLGRVKEVPKLPESAFNVAVFESQTSLFPNLWSFAKKDVFSAQKNTLQRFDVALIGGKTAFRKTHSHFSLHISK